jgi:hypothetical protein
MNIILVFKIVILCGLTSKHQSSAKAALLVAYFSYFIVDKISTFSKILFQNMELFV